jgi:hypothetical protein
MTNKTLVLSFAAIAASGLIASSASAATKWELRHPRQDQVLDRAHRQKLRITQERREGDITTSQARALKAQDNAVIASDRADAKANGGYITKSEQKALNVSENGINRQIPK